MDGYSILTVILQYNTNSIYVFITVGGYGWNNQLSDSEVMETMDSLLAVLEDKSADDITAMSVMKQLMGSDVGLNYIIRKMKVCFVLNSICSRPGWKYE